MRLCMALEGPGMLHQSLFIKIRGLDSIAPYLGGSDRPESHHACRQLSESFRPRLSHRKRMSHRLMHLLERNAVEQTNYILIDHA